MLCESVYSSRAVAFCSEPKSQHTGRALFTSSLMLAERTPLIQRLFEVLYVDNMHRCRAFDQCAPGDAGPLKSEHDSHLKKLESYDVILLLFSTEKKTHFLWSSYSEMIITVHRILSKLEINALKILVSY